MIFLTVFIYLLGFGIIIPIMPLLSQQFGATPVQTGLLLSMYSLMQFMFAPFWGSLSDRFGRRPILLGCLLGESLSYIIFAHANNLEMLFVARALAGFFGASISTANAAISDITPAHERSKGMAIIGAAFGLGFVFGPAIGGGLSIWGQHISSGDPLFATHFTMYWVAGICIASALVGFKFFSETLALENRHPHKRRRLSALVEKMRQPVVGPLMIVFFLASLAMSSMEANLVLFMNDKFGWGVKEVSFGFAYIGLIVVFTQGFFVRRLLPKVGERTTLKWGLSLFALGLAGIAFAPHISLMALTMTSLALGNGLINPSILGGISLLTGANEQGATLGSTQSLSSLGRILGPFLGGLVYEHIATNAPFLLSAFGALVGLTIAITLGGRVPDSAKLKASPA